jgi:hypothetical protein
MLNKVQNEHINKKIIKAKQKISPESYIVRNSDAILEVNSNNKVIRVILDLKKTSKEDELESSFKDKLQNSSNTLKQSKMDNLTEAKKDEKENYYSSYEFDYKCQSSTYILNCGHTTINTIAITKTKYKVLRDGMSKIKKVSLENVQNYKKVKVYEHYKTIGSSNKDLNKNTQTNILNTSEKNYNKMNTYLKNSNSSCTDLGTLLDTETR